jgi:anti-sigma-K factor RskA
MSGAGPDLPVDPPDDRAALYVLGVLNGEEMRETAHEAARDPVLARAVAWWEGRLMPLAALLTPVAPPASVWPELEAHIERLERGADAPAQSIVPGGPPLERRVSRRRRPAGVSRAWRLAAIGAGAVAAGLAVWIAVRPPAQVPSPTYAMLLPAAANAGGWLVRLEPGGTVTVAAQGALAPGANHDFELWALAQGGAQPAPVGLLPVTKAATLQRVSLPLHSFKLLVSLEPKGGSPTGAPTGPVVFASAEITR